MVRALVVLAEGVRGIGMGGSGQGGSGWLSQLVEGWGWRNYFPDLPRLSDWVSRDYGWRHPRNHVAKMS